METYISFAQLDHNIQQDDAVDDDWCEDGSDASELNREWKTRENEFHKMGYRDGVVAGKEASAQEGFNTGYKQAVLVGYNWGVVRGFTSALVSLPASLKDKLASAIESKDRLGRLHESVQSISTDDALKMFHEDVSLNELETPRNQPEESPIELLVDEAAGAFGQLRNYFRELESLRSEFPDIKFHWDGRTCVHKKYCEPH